MLEMKRRSIAQKPRTTQIMRIVRITSSRDSRSQDSLTHTTRSRFPAISQSTFNLLRFKRHTDYTTLATTLVMNKRPKALKQLTTPKLHLTPRLLTVLKPRREPRLRMVLRPLRTLIGFSTLAASSLTSRSRSLYPFYTLCQLHYYFLFIV
jgi:hypothetical protein